MRHILCLWACLALSACGGGQGISLLPYQDKEESPAKFRLCHGFGCSARTWVALSEKDWDFVTRPLRRKVINAAKERAQIAEAVARMERIVQHNTGMNADIGQATTFEKDQHQMDCLDETINSSRTLAFLADDGLLRYHDVGDPVHRGYFVDGMWPHNSAAVVEKDSGAVYAIDSYYFDNGKRVDVVPLDNWLDTWRPEELRPKVIPPKPGRKPALQS